MGEPPIAICARELEHAGHVEANDGDQLVRVPAAVAAPPEIAELVERVPALGVGVLFGQLAEALADHVGDLQVSELDHVGTDDGARLDARVGPPASRLLLLATDDGLIVPMR